MKGARLHQANFLTAKLTGVLFEQADLREANFEDAKLSGADFRRANLSQAVFDYADCTDADFDGAILSGAKLDKAQNLTQDQIDRAKGDKRTTLPEDLVRPDRWTGKQKSADFIVVTRDENWTWEREKVRPEHKALVYSFPIFGAAGLILVSGAVLVSTYLFNPHKTAENSVANQEATRHEEPVKNQTAKVERQDEDTSTPTVSTADTKDLDEQAEESFQTTNLSEPQPNPSATPNTSLSKPSVEDIDAHNENDSTALKDNSPDESADPSPIASASVKVVHEQSDETDLKSKDDAAASKPNSPPRSIQVTSRQTDVTETHDHLKATSNDIEQRFTKSDDNPVAPPRLCHVETEYYSRTFTVAEGECPTPAVEKRIEDCGAQGMDAGKECKSQVTAHRSQQTESPNRSADDVVGGAEHLDSLNLSNEHKTAYVRVDEIGHKPEQVVPTQDKPIIKSRPKRSKYKSVSPRKWRREKWYRYKGRKCKITANGRFKCAKRVSSFRRWKPGKWYRYRGRKCKIKLDGGFKCAKRR